MIFLFLALIYLSGVGSFMALRRQSVLVRHWSTHFMYAYGAMIAVIVVIGAMLVTHALVWGVLQIIRLLLYHVIIVQPLFLVTLIVIVWRDEAQRLSDALVVAKVHAVLIVTGALLALWSIVIEPYWLEVVPSSLTLPKTRAGSQPLRVAVLADLQNDTVGAHQHEVIDTLMAQQPDLILIPGDLYDTEAAHAHVEDFRALLGKLRAPGGVFMVVGDHDTIPMLELMTRGTQVTLLDDRTVRLQVKDRHVEVVGMSLPVRDSYRAALEEASRSSEHVRIVLVHRPRFVQSLSPEDEVDLVVAGHTHGGQINVPFFGPPVTISPLPRDIAAGGLHRVGGTPVYISRGVGGVQTIVPLMRFNCRPEISIITME